MSTLEIKNNLLEMVVKTNDPDILMRVSTIFAAILKGEEDWWNLISEQEKRQIEIGAAQAQAGQLVSSAAVREKARKILQLN